MPYQGRGMRHVVPGSPAHKACVHGQVVTEDGFVGAAFKTAQPAWNVLPSAVQNIATAEEFLIELGGILEAPRSGNLAAAVVGNDVYILTTDNTLQLAAQALTTGNLNANTRAVGKITEINATRGIVRIDASGHAVAQVKTGTGG